MTGSKPCGNSLEWRVKAGCGLLLAVVLATAAIPFRAAQLAAAELDSLLAGNDSTGIEALEVTLQQRRIVCHDRIVLDEIAAILRKPKMPEGYYGGTAYKPTSNSHLDAATQSAAKSAKTLLH